MARTSAGQFHVKDARPVLYDYNGQPWLHEAGTDDDTNPMLAYIESAAVEIQDGDGRVWHGVGMDPSIVTASLKAILSAVQRMIAQG